MALRGERAASVKRALSGRRVLITGASSGIGEVTARTFATAGARIAIVSEREAELKNVANSIQAQGGQAKAFVADLSCPDQVAGLLCRVEQQIGPLDILVNNAGVGMGAEILDTSLQEMRFLFEVNFFALAALCQQALAAMAPRGHGHIINVSSAAARFGGPTISAYSATKGAVHAFTQALRIEAAVHGIAVTEILPISVRTRFFDNMRGERSQPSGVVLTPELVAQSILRCAAARRPKTEVLPFPGIRALFVLNALSPGLLSRVARRSYAREVRQTRAKK